MKKTNIYYYISVLCLLMLLQFDNIYSQSISVMSIDKSNYPLIKAKVFIFDKAGNQLTGLDKSEISIKENNVPVEIISMTCPTAPPPIAVSSVLTIDQSGSMTGNGIAIAQNAAKAWVNGIPLGKSECALTGFDDKNYLYSDFTTDRNKLLSLIESIKPNGGTDFNAALIEQMAGAVLIAQDGKCKKVIVLLTDGMADGNVDKIVSEANKNNINIYSVILDNECPEVLKTISKNTSGQYFDKVSTVEQAESIYKAILQSVQGGEPCELEWISNTCSSLRNVEFSIPQLSASTNDTYTVESTVLPSLFINSANSYMFESSKPNKTSTVKLTITAYNKPITIDTVYTSNSLFSIKFSKDFPISINPNSSEDINLTFTPTDSTYQFSVIKFSSNACVGNTFYASGGYFYSPSDNPTIKVLFPNGGERFAASTDTLIKWEGVPPEDTVRIEYSTDKGQNWNLVSDTSLGLSQKWHLPYLESENCLVKVSMLNSSLNVNKNISGHTDLVSQIAWCPTNDNITSIGEDRKARILSSTSGKVLKNITSAYIFKACSWSPDANKIAYSLSDNSIILVEPLNGSIINTLTGAPQWSYYLSWIPDTKGKNDSLLLAACNDTKIYLWQLPGSAPAKTLDLQKGIIKKVIFNNNDQRLYCLTQDDGRIFYVENWMNNPKSVELTGSQFFPYYDFSINEARNEMIASRKNKDLSIIDLGTMQETKSIANTQADLVTWSKNGVYAAYTVQNQKNLIKIYDILQESEVTDLAGHTAEVSDIEWKKDNRTLASSSYDNSIKIWYFDNILQKDVSDSLFIISIPQISSVDVNFGNVTANQYKDTLVQAFLTNTSKVTVKIDSLTIDGNDKNLFKIVSYNPPYYIEPNTSKSLEFLFSPTYQGLKKANINIYYSGNKLTQQLSGNCQKQEIQLCGNYIDFGKMLIGTPKDTLANIIKNIDSSPVSIDSVVISGPDLAQFKIIDDNLKISVPTNQFLQLNLRFLPLIKGKTSTKLSVYYNKNSQPAITQLFGIGLNECGDYSFSFAGFPDLNNLAFVHSGHIDKNQLVLTESKQQEFSSVWYNYPVPVQRGFKTTFKFQFSSPVAGSQPDGSYLGADGFAFVIQNNNTESIGGSGGALGYEGIPNSLAIEFDMFANDSKQIETKNDPDGNHVAVQSMGMAKNSATHSAEATLKLMTIPFIVRSDSTTYFAKIEYNLEPNILKIYIDSTDSFANPLITISNLDLSQKLNLINNDMAYIGFTAATGDSYQKQTIDEWKFCTAEDVVSVPQNAYTEADEEVMVYPNPVNEMLNLINTNPNNMISEIKISDLLGNIIYELKSIESTEFNKINLRSLSRGTYFLSLKTSEKTIVKKFIKY